MLGDGSGGARAHLRLWLVVVNLVLLAPAVAAASSGGEVVGEVARGCCGHVASAALKAATAPSPKSDKKPPRPPAVYLGARPRDSERCFLHEDADHCFETAVLIDETSEALPAKSRALAYYRHACSLAGHQRSCERVGELERHIACRASGDCAGLFSEERAAEAVRLATARVPIECRSEASDLSEVSAVVAFASTGEAVSAVFVPRIEDAFVHHCVERRVLQVVVAPFDLEDDLKASALVTVKIALATKAQEPPTGGAKLTDGR